MGRMKRVTKQRPVQKTRINPNTGVSESYTVYESYETTEYVSGPDSYGPDTSGGSFSE